MQWCRSPSSATQPHTGVSLSFIASQATPSFRRNSWLYWGAFELFRNPTKPALSLVGPYAKDWLSVSRNRNHRVRIPVFRFDYLGLLDLFWYDGLHDPYRRSSPPTVLIAELAHISYILFLSSAALSSRRSRPKTKTLLPITVMCRLTTTSRAVLNECVVSSSAADWLRSLPKCESGCRR